MSASNTALTKPKVLDRPSSIINGELANIEDFPYYAFLAYGDESDARLFHCGGAIIRSDIILTAAHCLWTSDIKVYVGINTLDDLLTTTPYDAEKVLEHPDWDWRSSHDIGLIKLKNNITLDHVKVDTIKIAYDNPSIGVNATVVGFGKAECDSGEYGEYGYDFCPAEHLRSAVIRVVKIGGDNVIYTRGNNQNTCYGDSGGPIVYDGRVIAVVSDGEFANCTGYHIQAPVAPFYYWISKHINCF